MTSPLTCSAEELYTIISGSNQNWLTLSVSNPAITEEHLILLLRNPAITSEIIMTIADHQEWLSSYKIQFAIVNCPQTPSSLALRLLQLLFWHDLLKTSTNYRLHPRLRHTAETYLREKTPALSLGEKKTLARAASRGLIPFLRNEVERDVFAALLQNPRIVEDDLLVVVNNEMTPSQVLEAICSDFRWSSRYPIRLALTRNGKTPLRFSLSYLQKLRFQDLKQIVHSPAAATLVKQAAARLLSKE